MTFSISYPLTSFEVEILSHGLAWGPVIIYSILSLNTRIPECQQPTYKQTF